MIDRAQKFVKALPAYILLESSRQLTLLAAIPWRSGTTGSSHASASSALFGRFLPELSGRRARCLSSEWISIWATAERFSSAPSAIESERGFPQPTNIGSTYEIFGLRTGTEKLPRRENFTAELQRRLAVQ